MFDKIKKMFGGKSTDVSHLPEQPTPQQASLLMNNSKIGWELTLTGESLPESFALNTSKDCAFAFVHQNKVIAVLPMKDASYEVTKEKEPCPEFAFLQNYSLVGGCYPISQAWIQLNQSYLITSEVTKHFTRDNTQLGLKLVIGLTCITSQTPSQIKLLFDSLIQYSTIEDMSREPKSVLSLLENKVLPLFLNQAMESLQAEARVNPDMISDENLASPQTEALLNKIVTEQCRQIGLSVNITSTSLTENFSRRLMDVANNRQSALEHRQKLEDDLLEAAEQRARFNTEVRTADKIVAFQNLERELLVLQLQALQKKQTDAIKSGRLSKIQIRRKRWRYKLSKDLEPSAPMPFKDLALNIIMEIQAVEGLHYQDLEVSEANSDVWYPAYSNRSDFTIFKQAIEAAAAQFQVELPKPREYYEYTNDHQSVINVTLDDLVSIIKESPNTLHLVRRDSTHAWQVWEQMNEVASRVNS